MRLRISSDKTMEIAEALYQRGYLSYPRTETDKFKAVVRDMEKFERLMPRATFQSKIHYHHFFK